MANKGLNIVIFYGSYRRDRNGIRAVKFVQNQLEARGHTVTFVDAKEVDLPILDRMYKEYPKGEAPENLQKLADLYADTDAYVLVAGEYNHTIQPGLSNLVDHFLEEYGFRPSAVVAYSVGGFGGARVAVHLRGYLAELGMPAIPSALHVSKITQSLGEDGEDTSPYLTKAASKFLDELEWYGRALKAERAKGVPY